MVHDPSQYPIAFIFLGGQFSGSPVLSGSAVMISLNSSRKSLLRLFWIRIPFRVL